ncbi:hypothetical protein [Defluviimonas sp. SAOS-178_SWC]|uniref:hypothetical protein n=1 Tax=Defluviimonas sp. SAOS-178_SWC TaxID=3121287 RepID=UPI0032214C2D
MARYHHAYALDDASYLAAMDSLWDDDPASRTEKLWAAARETYRANSGNPVYNDMRVDDTWLALDDEADQTGEWALVMLAPYLTAIGSLSSSLASGFVEIEEWGMSNPRWRKLTGRLVRGDSIRLLFSQSPWWTVLGEARYIEQSCGWLSRSDCVRIRDDLATLVQGRAGSAGIGQDLPPDDSVPERLSVALRDATAMIGSATRAHRSILIAYED